jgi:hypothetical protein
VLHPLVRIAPPTGANRSTHWCESLHPLVRIAPPTGANRSTRTPQKNRIHRCGPRHGRPIPHSVRSPPSIRDFRHLIPAVRSRRLPARKFFVPSATARARLASMPRNRFGTEITHCRTGTGDVVGDGVLRLRRGRPPCRRPRHSGSHAHAATTPRRAVRETPSPPPGRSWFVWAAAHGFAGIADAWPVTHCHAPSFSTHTLVNRVRRSKGLPSLSVPASA